MQELKNVRTLELQTDTVRGSRIAAVPDCGFFVLNIISDPSTTWVGGED